jgi:hypothetical protein
MQRVKRMQFHSSQKIRKLHNDVELLFAEAFCQASVTEAKHRLRPKKFSVRDLFCGGMSVGITIALFFALVMLFCILSATPDVDLDGNKYFLSAFPVFRYAFLLIFFFFFLFRFFRLCRFNWSIHFYVLIDFVDSHI